MELSVPVHVSLSLAIEPVGPKEGHLVPGLAGTNRRAEKVRK